MMSAVEELRGRTGPFPKGRCLAGFSGGADSTAMMILLVLEREAGRLFPEAVHVNHHLRGTESDDDEAFCLEFCREWKVPLHTVDAELRGRSDENTCREERFRCFRKVLDDTGIRDLVLAHNRDDLAETFLMRLLRGSGLEGLACMGQQDERDGFTIWRPLLSAGRNEIRTALSADHVDWREDSLNTSDSYLRNRVRHKLVPLLEELSSGASGRIARTAAILRDEYKLTEDIPEIFLKQHSIGEWIDPEALKALPEAIRARILRKWWKQNTPARKEHTLNARQTDDLMKLLDATQGRINLPGGMTAVRGRNGLYLSGQSAPRFGDIPVYGRLNESVTALGITLSIGISEGNPGNGILEQEVPASFLSGCVVRTRRAGDRIRPFGMKGSRKLQDYLTDRHIDEPVRDKIPLLCRDNEVYLAAGVGAGAVPEWRAGNQNIRLRWKGAMPWYLNKEE